MVLTFDLTGYVIFAFVTLITPGPNNVMLFAHGKNFGFNDARKLMSGIFFGFMLMLFISGYGMAEILLKNQTLALILKIIGSMWLLYLAVVLSKLNHSSINESNLRIGFFQAFFMQFINPKAWIMALSGAATFIPVKGNIHVNVFIFVSIFSVLGIPCMMVWIKFGDLITQWLKADWVHKTLGMAIFLLMLISIIMIWL